MRNDILLAGSFPATDYNPTQLQLICVIKKLQQFPIFAWHKIRVSRTSPFKTVQAKDLLIAKLIFTSNFFDSAVILSYCFYSEIKMC